jgi:UDP-N-acetylglucosamine 4,6-dehydratase/5-epimerase
LHAFYPNTETDSALATRRTHLPEVRGGDYAPDAVAPILLDRLPAPRVGGGTSADEGERMTDMHGQRILITGGSGSFGRAFTRLALSQGADRVIVYSRSEERQRAMRVEIPDPRLDLFLGDVRDLPALTRAMQAWRLDAVLHCAALKQIPACEQYPMEAIKTNVIGSMHVIEAALDAGISRVLGISTDKAVATTTLYGATKATMEHLFVAANVYRGTHGTRFACVRYANVIGSTGSVIPIWRQQAAQGEALTVTDPEMTRCWWTLDEAVAFTVRALDEMTGGETFVPRLRACRLGDIADAISPHQVVTGVRVNEKTHEVLIAPEEPVVDSGWAYVVRAGEAPFGRVYSSDTAPRMTAQEVLGA